MSLDINNPWLIAIFGGVISAVFAGVILYYLFRNSKRKRFISITESSVNNADQLLEKEMYKEALAKYIEILKNVSEKREPMLYSNINDKEGICYCELAEISNKEDNLTKAIQAFEEALKIHTVEKYPEHYRRIILNIDLVKENLR